MKIYSKDIVKLNRKYLKCFKSLKTALIKQSMMKMKKEPLKANKTVWNRFPKGETKSSNSSKKSIYIKTDRPGVLNNDGHSA